MRDTANGNSIRYIIELDKKARERVAEAMRQAEEIDVNAQEKKHKLLSDYSTHAKERLEMVEKSYRESAEEKLRVIEDDKKKKMEAFDSALSKNREMLADQVFEAVTGSKRRK